MKLWQQWLGARIKEVKSTSPDAAYEQIGQQLRDKLRLQKSLDPTEQLVLSQLEDKIPGKLGIFIGHVYRTHMKSE